MEQVHSIEGLADGLTVAYTDQGVVYMSKGGQFEVAGEADGGEAWLNGRHYCWECDDGDVLLTNVLTGEVEMTFEDTDDGWQTFAREQLSK